MDLYPFQQKAVEFHLRHHYSINASEMGLGKSRMALATAKEIGCKPLVIGPTFLRRTWQDEGEKVGVPLSYCPYTQLHKLSVQQARRSRFWIVDECHYLKNPTAQRTHAFYSLLKECLPEHFIGLSGTPIKNRIPDMWTLLGFCSLNPKNTSGRRLEDDLRSYHKFARHFCWVKEQRIGGARFTKYLGIRDDRVEEFKSYLREKMIRFRVDQVLGDLPPITRKQVNFDMKAPEEGLQDIFEEYMLGHKVNIQAKARSALLKATLTVQYCKDLLEEGGEPLLVFTDHVESAKALTKISTGARLVTGQTPAVERMQLVSSFQAGRIPVLVATIGALSVGVTLTAARHVVFNDLSWVPSDVLQAEKRIHRIGQKDACFAHYINATPTDEHIRKTLFEKIETLSKVIA